MGDTTDIRPRATLSDRVSIYTALLLAATEERYALERYLTKTLPLSDLVRVLQASAEVAS